MMASDAPGSGKRAAGPAPGPVTTTAAPAWLTAAAASKGKGPATAAALAATTTGAAPAPPAWYAAATSTASGGGTMATATAATTATTLLSGRPAATAAAAAAAASPKLAGPPAAVRTAAPAWLTTKAPVTAAAGGRVDLLPQPSALLRTSAQVLPTRQLRQPLVAGPQGPGTDAAVAEDGGAPADDERSEPADLPTLLLPNSLAAPTALPRWRVDAVSDLHLLKDAFVKVVSGSLLMEPNYYDVKDATRRAITELAAQMAQRDPEFVLRLALYCRDDLNIRVTGARRPP